MTEMSPHQISSLPQNRQRPHGQKVKSKYYKLGPDNITGEENTSQIKCQSLEAGHMKEAGRRLLMGRVGCREERGYVFSLSN